jgi:E3 ubiquitin-protein ligase MARCH6
MEWLSHSHKKHCELCKTPFRFTKLYDANMPSKLPWDVFVRRAMVHVVKGILNMGRAALVGTVWLGVIPWVVRWVWRWLFWVADAAWAREAFVAAVLRMKGEDEVGESGAGNAPFTQFLDGWWEEPVSLRIAKILFGFTDDTTAATNHDVQNSTSTFTWPLTTPSLFSSLPHLESLTPSPRFNRLILDIFEGQLITCVVITGFILVFLIREWVVQQQPLVNLENLGNGLQQLNNAADRMQAENQRLQEQTELLENVRRTVDELLEARATYTDQDVEFCGWDRFGELIDQATEHIRSDEEGGKERFASAALDVTRQIRAGFREDIHSKDFEEVVLQKWSAYSDEEKNQWRNVLLAELNSNTANGEKVSGADAEDAGQEGEATGEDGSSRRPQMPDRDFSSRAADIQRLLADQDEQMRETAEIVAGIAAGLSGGSRGSESQRTPTSSSEAPAKEQEDLTSSKKRSFDPVPITNAGPDAKVNIVRSGKGKMRAVPAPSIDKKMVDDDEAFSKLKDEVNKEMEEEEEKVNAPSSSSASTAATAGAETPRNNWTPAGNPRENNPFHPEGVLPERRNSESFGNRVASVFREEFGLDEAEELEGLRQAGIRPDGENDPNDGQAEGSSGAEPIQQDKVQPHTFLQTVADWFWGDIEPPEVPEPVPPANEERQGQGENAEDNEDAQEAPFVPVQNGHPVVGRNDAQPAAAPAFAEDQAHDPEVLAAAQQAGLDPEAIEDAEDLEGIFELLGLQGPIIGLFQTSAFCMLLVAATIFGAVIAPYQFGKLVLCFLGSPVYWFVQLPLQIASFFADFVIDVVLRVGAWFTVGLALSVDFLLSAAQTWAPSLGKLDFIEGVFDFATSVGDRAGSRLQSMLAAAFILEPIREDLRFSWAFLNGSVYAHAELKAIGAEVSAILNAVGTGITWTVETISSGKVGEMCWRLLKTLQHLPGLMLRSYGSLEREFWQRYTQPVIDFVKNLSHGALTFSTPTLPTDPSLVYWSTTDRALAILTGYTALAALAALYVALDTPITKSVSGRRTEKSIRDGLRQAGGVLKVILIISIEMLVFPLYCGMLLDLAFLPLFREATVAGRWRWAGDKPYTFCFVHWFVGTCYMFHFALFVGMCRKILRKGVLWFVRDPDDPTFHPVRDVLERNVATQLRKIAFSALVYGALVILCLGGVVWTCVKILDGVFPIVWASTEPVLEFPVNLFLYNFVTPLVVRVFKPTDAMSGVYAWWLRKCARALRLSHFLFDERKTDEEGHYRHRTWKSFLTLKPQGLQEGESDGELYFQRDGKYVLTPCNDQYRPPKPGEAFLHVEDDDVYIADKDGKKNDHFAKVYVPPLFRVRVSLFMICLWLFSAVTGLCASIVPLVLGRKILGRLMADASGVNDIYAYSIGAYTLASVLFVVLKGRLGAAFLASKAKAIDAKVWIDRTKRFTARALKCTYVYGFLGFVVPIVFALLLQFYLVMPLQTWTASVLDSTADSTHSTAANTTSPANLTSLFASTADTNATSLDVSPLAESTFHILQGYALGLVYGRVAMRLILTAPASRAAEAFRRITADGYLNPNPRLATRFFVLPATLISLLLLLGPPLAAKVAMTILRTTSFLGTDGLSDDMQTKIYRYSYPLAASCAVVALAVVEVGRATGRWRTRIRDEVYLVGERLHNFGEKRPPEGSRSVVRKDK